MAVGFPASFSTEVKLVGSRKGAHEAVIGTFETLGWRHEAVSVDVYRVQVPMNVFSWGETLTVTLTDESTALIESKCRWPLQLFDWGQNKRNVDQFTTIFAIRDIREAKGDYKDPVYLDEKGRTPINRTILDNEPELIRKEESR